LTFQNGTKYWQIRNIHIAPFVRISCEEVEIFSPHELGCLCRTIVYFWSFFCIAVVLIMSAVVATFIDSYKATICTQAVLERKEQMKTCLLAFDLLAEKIEVVSEEQNCEEKLRIVNAVSKATLKNLAKHVNAHIAKNQLKLFCDSACDVVTTVDGEDDAFSTEKNFVRFCRLVIECSHLTRQHSNGSGSKDGQYKTDGQYKVPQNNSDANSNSSVKGRPSTWSESKNLGIRVQSSSINDLSPPFSRGRTSNALSDTRRGSVVHEEAQSPNNAWTFRISSDSVQRNSSATSCLFILLWAADLEANVSNRMLVIGVKLCRMH